jgi:hypothetical protein
MIEILRTNKFARDMLTIATIGCLIAALAGAERDEREYQRMQAERNQQTVIYEVPE